MGFSTGFKGIQGRGDNIHWRQGCPSLSQRAAIQKCVQDSIENKMQTARFRIIQMSWGRKKISVIAHCSCHATWSMVIRLDLSFFIFTELFTLFFLVCIIQSTCSTFVKVFDMPFFLDLPPQIYKGGRGGEFQGGGFFSFIDGALLLFEKFVQTRINKSFQNCNVRNINVGVYTKCL